MEEENATDGRWTILGEGQEERKEKSYVLTVIAWIIYFLESPVTPLEDEEDEADEEEEREELCQSVIKTCLISQSPKYVFLASRRFWNCDCGGS